MKKDIKIIGILNIANYINNIVLINYFSIYRDLNLVEDLDTIVLPIVLVAWILSPVVLMLMMIYPLIVNKNKLYKNFRNELILYFSLNSMAYLVLLSYTNTIYLSYIYFVKILIQSVLMIITLVIILTMYIKTPQYRDEGIKKFNFITQEDRKNINNLKRAKNIGINSLFSFIIFGLSLVLISYEEISWKMGGMVTIMSVVSFVMFVYKNYEKCKLAYLDENKRMKILKKEMISMAISYSICIIASMNLFKVNDMLFRQFIFLISIMALYPIIIGNREILLKYKNVKASLINGLIECYRK